MKDLVRLLSLPAGLLFLRTSPCADAQELEWPHNLPRNVKYYPEDEKHVKKELEIQERLKWQVPSAVRKMSDSPDEKFYMNYWEFADLTANASSIFALSAPVAPHKRQGYSRLLDRSIFERDFQCPANTVSCSSIGSDLCCQSDETCVNTSNGVGCCPRGATCGDVVAGCDTGAGFTNCPGSDNGGCCLPGATCLDSGCAFYGTQTIAVTLPTRTVVSTPTPTQSSQIPGSTVVVTSAMTQVQSEEGSTITQTVTALVTITAEPSCAQGFFSCPASLGGGCCPNGQGCATDDNCPDLTASSTTAAAAPPVRPTSSAATSDSSVTLASIPVSTSAAGGECPAYYYMCEARYLGGCCRVDRNCDTTSCPPISTTNIITSSLTIGIGVLPTGQCMTSWQSCAASDGGGCCPPGYACGTNCVASGGTQTAAKEAPTSNSAFRSTKSSSSILALILGAMVASLAI